MMFSSVRRRVLGIAAVLTAAAANAATSQQVTEGTGMDDTVRAASAIFIGRVTDAKSRWGTPAKRWIATDFTFSVEEAILPNGPVQKGRTVVVTYRGGTMDGETQGIVGQVLPAKGQRYVMMLSADYDKPGKHPEAGGSGQGLFKIVQERKGGPFIVTDAHGGPLYRFSDGRILRVSEARDIDQKTPGVTIEQFSQWARQAVARLKSKPNNPPRR